MSDTAYTASEALDRFLRHDPTLRKIDLTGKGHTDLEVGKLVDFLLVHPNVVTRIDLHSNELTDVTGVKLAQYLAASSTIDYLGLAYNDRLGSPTYLAMANALRTNSSLRELHLHNRNELNRQGICCTVFVEALVSNPKRPIGSCWQLYIWHQDDLPRLKAVAAGQLAYF